MPKSEFPKDILMFKNFFPPEVVAFVSNRTVDFTRKNDTLCLSGKQKEFLSRHAGVKISRLPNIKQIHGKRIIVAKRFSCLGTQHPLKADGMITKKSALPLTVRTADCLSVFLFDPKRQVIGLVHAGWKGTRKKIVSRTVGLLKKQFQVNAKDLKVAFGPSIRFCCYEVSREFKSLFPKALRPRGGRLFLDLPLENKKQLLKAGVSGKNIFDCGICTHCNPNYFSYRRQGDRAGRMISLMMLKNKGEKK